MITKFQKFQIIKETPDHVYYYDEENDIEEWDLDFDDQDALPFFADVNYNHTKVEEVHIGNYRQWHSNFKHKGKNPAYSGRLWDDDEHKVISFWVYPDIDLFRQIIKKLEEKLKIKIFNNNWLVEIIDDGNNKIPVTKFDPDNDEYFFREDEDPSYGDMKLIPIEEYAGSDDVPEELQIQHLMNWKEKELAKKIGKLHFKGFGSDKMAWDSKHNIKYRQTIYQEKKRIINDNKI